ncbi:MAG TPA: hypothetical protein VFQ36_24655, partial [Ktedonobacteraceae bacterium]|nr:hypothetical protein [Ktedonobacteraceae bacterium]
IARFGGWAIILCRDAPRGHPGVGKSLQFIEIVIASSKPQRLHKEGITQQYTQAFYTSKNFDSTDMNDFEL